MLSLDLPARNFAVDFQEHGYVVEEFVGRGQFGRTYKVRYEADSSIWLAKSIDLSSIDEKDKILSLQEAAVMQTLSHPAIVEWRESFVHRDMFLVIIMEFCRKGDLLIKMEELRDLGEFLSEEYIVQIATQLSEALRYIHSRNILHRDIKPSNIFLTENGDIKIGDFGISRLMTTTLAMASTAIGTPQYMSPEMCESKPYTYKSDVWALGCVIYEAAALRNAFEADSFLALVWAIASKPPKRLPDRYSEDLQYLVDWLLSKDADARPSPVQILSLPFIQKQRLLAAYDATTHKAQTEETEQSFTSDRKENRFSDSPDDWASRQLLADTSVTTAIGGGDGRRRSLALAPPRSEGKPHHSFRRQQFHIVLGRIKLALQEYKVKNLIEGNCVVGETVDENKTHADDENILGINASEPLTIPLLHSIVDKIKAPVSELELEFMFDKLTLNSDSSYVTFLYFLRSLDPSMWEEIYLTTLEWVKKALALDQMLFSEDGYILQKSFRQFDGDDTGAISRSAFRAVFHIFFPQLANADLEDLYNFAPKTFDGHVTYDPFLYKDLQLFYADISTPNTQSSLLASESHRPSDNNNNGTAENENPVDAVQGASDSMRSSRMENQDNINDQFASVAPLEEVLINIDSQPSNVSISKSPIIEAEKHQHKNNCSGEQKSRPYFAPLSPTTSLFLSRSRRRRINTGAVCAVLPLTYKSHDYYVESKRAPQLQFPELKSTHGNNRCLQRCRKKRRSSFPSASPTSNSVKSSMVTNSVHDSTYEEDDSLDGRYEDEMYQMTTHDVRRASYPPLPPRWLFEASSWSGRSTQKIEQGKIDCSQLLFDSTLSSNTNRQSLISEYEHPIISLRYRKNRSNRNLRYYDYNFCQDSNTNKKLPLPMEGNYDYSDRSTAAATSNSLGSDSRALDQFESPGTTYDDSVSRKSITESPPFPTSLCEADFLVTNVPATPVCHDPSVSQNEGSNYFSSVQSNQYSIIRCDSSNEINHQQPTASDCQSQTGTEELINSPEFQSDYNYPASQINKHNTITPPLHSNIGPNTNRLHHRAAVDGRIEAAISMQILLHHIQGERAASCGAAAATSSTNATQSKEKALSRLLDHRTRTDDAFTSAKRTVILSFYAQRSLLRKVKAKEGTQFAIIIHDGCLLLNTLSATLASHRAIVDSLCRRKWASNDEDNSSVGSPWSNDSTVELPNEEIMSEKQRQLDNILAVWSSRFLYVTEQLTTDLSQMLAWLAHLVSALKSSPYKTFHKINQLRELLSSQLAFTASRQPDEHLKTDWDAARFFMGLVVARKSVAASFPSNNEIDHIRTIKQISGHKQLADFEAKLLHSADADTVALWRKSAVSCLSKLQASAIHHLNDLKYDLRSDLETEYSSQSRSTIK